MLIRKWQSESVWPKHHDAYKNELSVIGAAWRMKLVILLHPTCPSLVKLSLPVGNL